MTVNDNTKVVKTSGNGQWIMVESDNSYYFAQIENDETVFVRTPGGNLLRTIYIELADRILNDLDKFGYNYHSSESILAWHATMIDNFSRMDHSYVEAILDQSFMQRPDWTLKDNQEVEEWTDVFGKGEERNALIREWLSKCTHMQMTAACCIGNAYNSINVAFVLARLMEDFEGCGRAEEFNALASLIEDYSFYGPFEDNVVDFKTFELYYGIHLKEDGPIIHDMVKEERSQPDAEGFIGIEVSAEALAGRNFYLYNCGKKAEIQPVELILPDLNLDIDDEEEYECEDEENYELEGILPAACWVKRLRADGDGFDTYHLVAVKINDSGAIDNITVILEEVSRMCGGWVMMPGMELQSSSSYFEISVLPDDVMEELKALVSGRYLKSDFSFVGRKLPQAMIDSGGNGGSDTEYTYAQQSAHRMAYMHMSIDTEEDGTIEGFSYSTYQSSGSSYGDMFSRPVYYSDRQDEAVDMLLYILDQYSDEEFGKL